MDNIWLYMTLTNLIIPFVMLSFGAYFYRRPPKGINVIFGYRTKRSMQNEETWKFAHQYFGKLWFLLGMPTLIITIGAMWLLYSKKVNILSIVGILITLVQLITVFITIVLTERALKHSFDNNGNLF